MPGEGKEDSNRAINGDARRNTTDNSNSGGQQNRRAVATTLAQEMMIDTEEAVMANFDFLSSEVFKVYFNLCLPLICGHLQNQNLLIRKMQRM